MTIAQYLDAHRGETTRSILSELPRALLAETVLRHLGSDADEVPELRHHSYAHENGFTKLTIGQSSDALLRVRLHAWNASQVRGIQPNVHTHCFHLASRVLKGTLEDRVWEPSRAGHLFQHFLYRPPGGQSEYTLQWGGTAFLSETAVTLRKQGESYGHDAWVLHTSHPVEEVVTLFVEDSRQAPSFAHVYSLRYGPQDQTIRVPIMSVAQYRDSLRRLWESVLRSWIAETEEA